MDLTFNAAELAFRDELRAWLSEHTPTDEPLEEDKHFQWRLKFHHKLAAEGWAAVHWPKEYGGREATLMQSAIFYEELAHAGAPLPVEPARHPARGTHHHATGALRNRRIGTCRRS